jgi:glycerophosphoryl diester phosphodiesterase
MEEAVRRGYWMLEVDIRSSSDGHPVVHHDADFRRDYGEAQRVADLTWAEIQTLRSRADGLPPLDFAQVAAYCRHKMRLMLDVKPEQADERFFRAIEQALIQNDLLPTTYLIGSDGAKRHFGNRLKVSVDGRSLRAAIERGEPVAEKYFVFGVAAQIDADTVRLAQQYRVDVVPAVNTFRYLNDDENRQAADDVGRLRGLGVRRFQIDSIYEPLFHVED